MRFHSTTGDNYEAKAGTLFDLLLRRKVNIFNISNINSEVRGGKSPRRREGPPRKIYTPSSRSARLTPASSSSSPSGVVCVSHTENARLATVVSQSSVLDQIGGGSLESSSSTITGSVTPSSPPVFTTEAEKTIAKIAYDVIQSFENCRVPNSCCKRRFRRKSPHGTKIAQLVSADSLVASTPSKNFNLIQSGSWLSSPTGN
jgi:hypothetical protein